MPTRTGNVSCVEIATKKRASELASPDSVSIVTIPAYSGYCTSTPATEGTAAATARTNERGRQCSSSPMTRKAKMKRFSSSSTPCPEAMTSVARYTRPSAATTIVRSGLYSSHPRASPALLLRVPAGRR
jgi:hypothetical protein